MAGKRSRAGVVSGAEPALPARRLFTVDEYYRMAEVGILQEDDRIELIEGEIIRMTPKGIWHAACITDLTGWFIERLQRRAIVDVQNPVRLSQFLEPVPDLMLLHRRPDYYRERHPAAADVFLLIEVADTSLAYDQRTKLPLYAREGIPETWIVDLDGQRIEAHRRPVDGRYQEVSVYERGSSLAPDAFPDVVLTVDEILG